MLFDLIPQFVTLVLYHISSSISDWRFFFVPIHICEVMVDLDMGFFFILLNMFFIVYFVKTLRI